MASGKGWPGVLVSQGKPFILPGKVSFSSVSCSSLRVSSRGEGALALSGDGSRLGIQNHREMTRGFANPSSYVVETVEFNTAITLGSIQETP
jgi:hypothetical protein